MALDKFWVYDPFIANKLKKVFCNFIRFNENKCVLPGFINLLLFFSDIDSIKSAYGASVLEKASSRWDMICL